MYIKYVYIALHDDRQLTTQLKSRVFWSPILN